VAIVRTWLRITPGSARPGVGGSYPRPGEAALRVSVRERAVDGRASRAALALVAAALEVPARSVALDVGRGSRDKLISIETGEPTAVARRLRVLKKNPS
jgi:uncharacterized protein